GRVFLARQLDLGRQVVIKVMHEHIAADPRFRERFQRETLLMARLQHPNAVTLIDASLNDPEGPCIVMEYVKGVSLDKLLARNGRLSHGRVGRLIGQLCEVLQAAHDLGIIHRDLKPSNLMITTPETPREMLKVMDFGLAKLVDGSVLKRVTDTNVDFAVGTPGYICPEQVRGEEMDSRGDIYSVGVIMYELLTGRLPFPGPEGMDMMLAHATDTPPSFAELNLGGTIPRAIEDLVFACLEKDPELRPQTARDLAERYETALAHEEALVQASAFDADDPSFSGEARPDDPLADDPTALCFRMEAWMPEKIALVKLRGFVHDARGEVLESVPGLIRVRIGSRPEAAGKQSPSPLDWLPFSRRNGPVDMEMRLAQADPRKENHLLIQVLFRPGAFSQLHDRHWRARCTQLFIEVRAYLMGT
ncbi:MAG TPA: serine/threonine-protein kinase, partial [Gemmataceae bacterium]